MTSSTGAFPQLHQDDVQHRYQAISRDCRYGHYVRIPERICLCLDYFKVGCDRQAVKERLRAYYLFIGVADDAIDSSQLETGRIILQQLEEPNPRFDDRTRESDAGLVTEILKCHISSGAHPEILARLQELFRAVMDERRSTTMTAYIKQRKRIGHLTAEISFLLIRPLFRHEHVGLRPFLQRVGEVGCLLDSLIDLRADARLGLVGFRPGINEHFELMRPLLREGFGILLGHMRLMGLFLEAIVDNLRDFRFRVAGQPGASMSIAATAVPERAV